MRWRAALLAAFIILARVTVGRGARRQPPGVPHPLFLPLGLAGTAVLLILFVVWRCPACGRGLALDPNWPATCPACGAQLR
jgi:rubrerythrin